MYLGNLVLILKFIINFFKLLSDKFSEDEKMFTELVHIFNEAWLLLKNQLTSHGMCMQCICIKQVAHMDRYMYVSRILFCK